MIQDLEEHFNSKVSHNFSLIQNAIKQIRCDGGGEYKGSELSNRMSLQGNVHENPTKYSCKSSGHAERLNNTFLDMSRTIQFVSKGKLKRLLAEAVNTRCYLRNRLVTMLCENLCDAPICTQVRTGANYLLNMGHSLILPRVTTLYGITDTAG